MENQKTELRSYRMMSQSPCRDRYDFASDNCAGICLPALECLVAANEGYCPSYGDDRWTERASDLLREVFETNCAIFFCFTGTAANSMAIGHLCDSYHSVLCHAYAHLETDECGAPEFFTHGTKVILLPGEHGKIDPEGIRQAVERRKDIHYPKPRVLSLTQITEMGTAYTPAELRNLCQVSHQNGLRVHMDGARFANAVVSLGVTPKEISWQAGVEVLCLGGAKNGMPCGEAVIFFDQDLADEFDYRCKQAGQLASKMRFMAAPWVGMLEAGLWLKNAAHANRMATLLKMEIESHTNFYLLHPQEANSVFVDFPAEVTAYLHRQGWHFYSFIGTGGARLMCSWQTTEKDIQDLMGDILRAPYKPVE
jgi:threonine aldolase